MFDRGDLGNNVYQQVTYHRTILMKPVEFQK